MLQGAQTRHKDATDPVEVLAAFGGFEMAMMVGVMLVAGSKRHLVIADGMTACAALMVASRIAPAVTDYCVYCRSHNHQGLDRALALFQATALLELGMESTDGTGATLAWPLVRSAAALLTEVAEGEDPGPSLPAPMFSADRGPDPCPEAAPQRFVKPGVRGRGARRPPLLGRGGRRTGQRRPACRRRGQRLLRRRRRGPHRTGRREPDRSSAELHARHQGGKVPVAGARQGRDLERHRWPFPATGRSRRCAG